MGFVEVEAVGLSGVSPEGLDHFPDAGAPRGGMKETDGLGLRPRFGDREACEFCLRIGGLFRLSVWTGGFCDSGLAHFEIGGAHFPRPAGVDVVSGDGGGAGLLGISHALGRALTCVKR